MKVVRQQLRYVHIDVIQVVGVEAPKAQPIIIRNIQVRSKALTWVLERWVMWHCCRIIITSSGGGAHGGGHHEGWCGCVDSTVKMLQWTTCGHTSI